MLKKQLLHIIQKSHRDIFGLMSVQLPMILSTVTLLAAYPVDRVVDQYVSGLPKKSLLRCADTALHGIIAALVWTTACVISSRRGYDLHLIQLNTQNRAREDYEHDLITGVSTPATDISFYSMKNDLWPLKVMEICAAFFIGGPVIDADHFMKAWSLDIEKAILYPGRGFLHWTSLTLTLTGLLIITSLIVSSNLCVRLGALIFICTFSHQIRDATHRGLSFYPLPSTPICPYYLYVIITILMPYLVAYLFTSMRQKEDPPYHSVIVI